MLSLLPKQPRFVLSLIAGGILLSLTPAAMADAPIWAVDPSNSKIEFSGTQSGEAFTGQIRDFKAEITFDADHLDQSHILATIDMSSAQTGDKMIDGSLSSDEWLNPGKFPKAVFETVSLEDKGSGKENIEHYVAHGHLTILGVSKDMELPFSLKTEGQHAIMDGQLTLNRLDYGIGKDADGNAEWVSDPILVKIHVEASRTP
ncbi:MAG: hypothetical protein AUJ12_02930 [Alphaproteobacteria bacterium CG1_02_46_17]|nr:MAG: hypothetical protein AUJ12_02930 [Alphaproteobacteria bacterium CG1_02_46_17]